MTQKGIDRQNYSRLVEVAPSRFFEPEAYEAWTARADEWVGAR